MTKKEQQIAIGEWIGWFWHGDASWQKDPNEYYWGTNPTSEPEDHIRYCLLPDFTEDLNAIHKAENHLVHTYEYQLWLERLTNRNEWHATAQQRAEALCRTLWPEKWKVYEKTLV